MWPRRNFLATKFEGECRGEAEDLLVGECLQIGTERRLDVARCLANLHVLERADEVARQLLHREPVCRLGEHARRLESIDEPLAGGVQLDLRDERSTAEDCKARLLEALGHVRL